MQFVEKNTLWLLMGMETKRGIEFCKGLKFTYSEDCFSEYLAPKSAENCSVLIFNHVFCVCYIVSYFL